MPTPVKTPTKTDSPSESPFSDPERYYSPERLCPSQRDGAEKFARP